MIDEKAFKAAMHVYLSSMHADHHIESAVRCAIHAYEFAKSEQPDNSALVRMIAERITAYRYVNHEKGNTQSLDEYVYYCWDKWKEEAEYVLIMLKHHGLLNASHKPAPVDLEVIAAALAKYHGGDWKFIVKLYKNGEDTGAYDRFMRMAKAVIQALGRVYE